MHYVIAIPDQNLNRLVLRSVPIWETTSSGDTFFKGNRYWLAPLLSGLSASGAPLFTPRYGANEVVEGVFEIRPKPFEEWELSLQHVLVYEHQKEIEVRRKKSAQTFLRYLHAEVSSTRRSIEKSNLDARNLNDRILALVRDPKLPIEEILKVKGSPVPASNQDPTLSSLTTLLLIQERTKDFLECLGLLEEP